MGHRFKGRVVLVTGAGRGMGKTIAAEFLKEGASVMLAARTMSYGEATLAEFRSQGWDVALTQADVLVPADIERLVSRTVEQFGALDVIVHSAAEIPSGTVTTITDDEIEATLASSIKAGFRLMRAGVPHLAKSAEGGRLIFISSIAGNRTVVPGLVHYGAAKAGLNALIAGAAFELARSGITVNGIEPGVTLTDRTLSLLPQEQVDASAASIPVGRNGVAEDMANAVLFFADPKSSYVTGRVLTVDGGMTLSATSLGSPPEFSGMAT